MEQTTVVTTTTASTNVSLQSCETIVESTCAAALIASNTSANSNSGVGVNIPAVPAPEAATTGGSGVLKNILKSSASVSPAATTTVSNPPGKIFGRNNNGTSKYNNFFLYNDNVRNAHIKSRCCVFVQPERCINVCVWWLLVVCM